MPQSDENKISEDRSGDAGKRPVKSRRGWPMTLVVGGAFGLLIAISVALVLYLSIKANVENTFALLNDKAVLIVNSLDGQLTENLDQARQTTVGVAELLSRLKVDFKLQNRDRLQDILSSAVMSHELIDVVVAIDLNGDEYGVYKNEDGQLEYFQRRVPDEVRLYVLQDDLTADSEPAWGPLVPAGDKVFVNVTAPLVMNGKLAGYIASAMATTHITRLVTQIDEGIDQTNFVLAGGYQVLAHSDQEEIEAATTLPSTVARFGDPVLARIAGAEKAALFDKAASEGVEVRTVELPTGIFVVMSQTIRGFSSDDWTIGAYFKRDSIGSEVQRVFLSAIAGFVALIVALVLAVLIARRTTRPLLHVAAESQKVAELDLDTIKPLPSSRVRELNQLATAFNSMVAGLKAFNTYVPKSLFSKLMDIGFEKATQSRELELTILFSDIAEFTTMSENMNASETASFLNKHFAVLVEAVEAEGGTVDKFMGDGMLAFWGAPDARDD
ncbi:MAG: HAMP domain-containing protein, partial [Stappiaceae bacterium]